MPMEGVSRIFETTSSAATSAKKIERPAPLLATLRSQDSPEPGVKSFVLDSGSLKNMARRYGVSYPTVRNRLDDPIVYSRTTLRCRTSRIGNSHSGTTMAS